MTEKERANERRLKLEKGIRSEDCHKLEHFYRQQYLCITWTKVCKCINMYAFLILLSFVDRAHRDTHTHTQNPKLFKVMGSLNKRIHCQRVAALYFHFYFGSLKLYSYFVVVVVLMLIVIAVISVPFIFVYMCARAHLI